METGRDVFCARAVEPDEGVYWFASRNGKLWYEVDGPEFQSRAHLAGQIEAEVAPFERAYLLRDFPNIEFYGTETDPRKTPWMLSMQGALA